MPVLNTRFQAQAKDGQGNSVRLPQGAALQQAGPRVQITLSPLEEQIRTLADKGASIPTPVVGHALIDTGASATCIDRETAENAGLAVVGSGPMYSATHEGEIVPIFAGMMKIHGLSNVETRSAYGANLSSQGLIALIGRDILSKCILVYNGTDNSFSISL